METTVKQSELFVEKESWERRKSRLKGYWSRHWSLYVMLLPVIIFLFIFSYLPMINIMIAFTVNNVIQPVWTLDWVGLANFERAFSIPPFWDAIRNTIMYSFLDLIIAFPAPIILALLLNELKFERFKKITQTISYMPHFISWIIIAGMSRQLFLMDNGMINNVLGNIGIGPIPFLESSGHWIWTNVFLQVWRSVGWGTILYLAAITNVSPELYEAAEMDGASRLRKMWHITLPGIRPTIITLFILTIGGVMNADLQRYLALENSFVRGVSEVIPTFIFRWGLQSFQFSLAAAIGIFQGIIGMVLLLSGNWFVKKLGGNGFW